jgi:hypothetical protein
LRYRSPIAYNGASIAGLQGGRKEQNSAGYNAESWVTFCSEPGRMIE